jgi:hypothetical protein
LELESYSSPRKIVNFSSTLVLQSFGALGGSFDFLDMILDYGRALFAKKLHRILVPGDTNFGDFDTNFEEFDAKLLNFDAIFMFHACDFFPQLELQAWVLEKEIFEGVLLAHCLNFFLVTLVQT